MKLSQDTIDVVKFFQDINQGIVFRVGKTLKTMSGQKNILAEATIAETIPVDFGIYDLKEFLGALSIFKGDFDITFGDKRMEIKGRGAKSKTFYTYTEPSLIVTPPDTYPTMTGQTVSFSLTKDDLDWVLNTAAVLGSPQIVVESDGKKVYLSTMDIQNDAANTNKTEICDGNGDKYRLIFKVENFKLLPGDYAAQVSSKFGLFTNKAGNLKVWISTEVGSTFGDKN